MWNGRICLVEQAERCSLHLGKVHCLVRRKLVWCRSILNCYSLLLLLKHSPLLLSSSSMLFFSLSLLATLARSRLLSSAVLSGIPDSLFAKCGFA